jgi:hypothetical protein
MFWAEKGDTVREKKLGFCMMLSHADSLQEDWKMKKEALGIRL